MDHHPVEHWCVRQKVSIWLIFVSACLTTVVMHPSFAAVVVFFLNLGLLFVMRATAHLEGRHSKE